MIRASAFFCLMLCAFCLLTLPLSLFDNRFSVESDRASRQMTASVERRSVVAAGPGIESSAEANHSRISKAISLALAQSRRVK